VIGSLTSPRAIVNIIIRTCVHEVLSHSKPDVVTELLFLGASIEQLQDAERRLGAPLPMEVRPDISDKYIQHFLIMNLCMPTDLDVQES
jgi:hypothetical protein